MTNQPPPSPHSAGPHVSRRALLQFGAFSVTVSLAFGTTVAASPTARATTADDGSIVDRLRPEHPRLMASAEDFAAIRARLAFDPESARWYEKLREEGERILAEPVAEYELPDGVRLLVAGQVRTRIYTLAMLYQLGGEERFAERAWAELEAGANFPDWHPPHFLDTATMTHAFGIGYDWLHDYWTPERRQVMRDAIVQMGLTPGIEGALTGAWWVTTNNNWNIVCHGGLGIGALSVGEEAPEQAEEILQTAREFLPRAIAEYAPDGAYPEGVSYWSYATTYLVPYLAALRSAIGDDLGLSDSPGLADTGFFPIYLAGPKGSFNYYDAGSDAPRPPEMFWLAKAYDQPVFSWWGVQGADANPDPNHLLWYDPDHVTTPYDAGLAFDRYFRHSEVMTFRNAWADPAAVYVGFKAGDNRTNHGDLDLGTFVLDALGVRWAVDLGSEDYNVPGYWDGGEQGGRWAYYRKRTEGQNTLVVDPGEGPDQAVAAAGTIVRRGSGPTQAFAIADLTEAHAARGVTSWQRGVALLDHRRQLLVQDELDAERPVEAWWFMHTAATVRVADDGRSATLQHAGRRLLVRILSSGDADAQFVAMDAKPLWTSPDPAEQTVNAGIAKLGIHVTAVQRLRLAVLLTPLRVGQDADCDVPEVEPLSEWAVSHPDVPLLDEVTIDGEPLPGFAPQAFTYDIEVPADTGHAPTVVARASQPGVRVITHRAAGVPGTARVDVIRAGAPRIRYEIHFQHPLADGRVVASADDGNVPENTLDGSLTTRWSAEGDGQWIRYDLGAPTTVHGVSIAWYQGATRSSSFDIQVSTDAETWTTVHSGTSSGQTVELESYPIEPTTARYVRLVGHGNSLNDWNSITEVRITLADGEWPEPDQGPPTLRRVELTADAERLRLGETARLELVGYLSDGSEADLSELDVRFVSSDETVARVGPDGVVEALAEGTTRLAGIVTTKDRQLKYDTVLMPVDDPTKMTLHPVADAYVNDGASADTNFGGATILMVKKSGVGYNRESYLAFDLSEVDAPVEAATLHLHGAVNDTEGTEIDVHFHEVVEPWDEKTITWNTKPSVGERVATLHLDDVRDWRAVDLTEHVRRLVAEGRQLDLAIVQDPPLGTSGLYVDFRSREDSARRPYLQLRLARPAE